MGGIEQVIDHLCQGTKMHKIESSVLALTISSKYPPNIIFNGYKIHLVKRDFQFAATDFSIMAFRRFSELAKKADVIHYHFPWPFMDLVHFASQIKKPSIVTYHSDIVRQKNLLWLYHPLMNAFLNSVNEIVVTSPNYLRTSNVLQRYKDKSTIIPIGLDKSSYPSPDLTRNEYWKDRFGTRFFLFIGVLRYYKGINIMLQANAGSDFPVVIVGDGPLKESLQEEANQLGLRNTYFLGAISEKDKVALLSLCYGIVFPSNLRSEAFGISLLEGAMFGKPMISCEIGTGTSYINLHNLTGLVVQPNNPDALRKAMIDLWCNPELAAEMGKNAEDRFKRYFTSSQMVQKYSDIYLRLCK